MSKDNDPKRSVIRKIQKLLELAGDRNPNEHERARAMEQVSELLAKYNLDMAQVKAQAEDKPDLRYTDIIVGEDWQRTICHAAARLYFTSLLVMMAGRKKRAVFIGSPENIEVTVSVAKWLIASVVKESRLKFTSIKGDNITWTWGASNTKLMRRSFCLGAADRLGLRAEEIRRRQNARQSSTPGTSLMVIRNQLEKRNADFIEELNVPNVESKQETADFGAYKAGWNYAGGIGLEKQITGAK